MNVIDSLVNGQRVYVDKNRQNNILISSNQSFKNCTISDKAGIKTTAIIFEHRTKSVVLLFLINRFRFIVFVRNKAENLNDIFNVIYEDYIKLGIVSGFNVLKSNSLNYNKQDFELKSIIRKPKLYLLHKEKLLKPLLNTIIKNASTY